MTENGSGALRRRFVGLVGELGAELAADAPHQATLPCVIMGEDDGEIRRDLEIFGHHLDAAVGNIRDGAVARQGAGSGLNFGNPPANAAFMFASIGCQHVHKVTPNRKSLIRPYWCSRELLECSWRHSRKSGGALRSLFTMAQTDKRPRRAENRPGPSAHLPSMNPGRRERELSRQLVTRYAGRSPNDAVSWQRSTGRGDQCLQLAADGLDHRSIVAPRVLAKQPYGRIP